MGNNMAYRIDDELHEFWEHETRNPCQVISGHLDLRKEGKSSSYLKEFEEGYDSEEEVEEAYQEIEDFISHVKMLDEGLNHPDEAEDAEVSRFLYEDDIQELEDHQGRYSGRLGDLVDRVAYATRGVFAFQQHLDNGDYGAISIGEIMEYIDSVGEVEYNGHENDMIKGDESLLLPTTTWVKNLEENVEDPRMGAVVNEYDNGHEYEILVWDNGEGMSEEETLGGGIGLPMAEYVTEEFGGEFRNIYKLREGRISEEWIEAADRLSRDVDGMESGDFGSIFSWKLMKPDQNSTPESL